MGWTLTDLTTAVNLTAEADASSVVIAHRAYAETSRLTGRIIDESGVLTIATEHEINLSDGGVTAFAGYIRVCKKADRGVSTQRVYEIEAQDYTTALGDDVADSDVALRANGESDKARITALFSAFGTRGIVIGASVVQLRAVMPDQDLRGLNLHQCLSAICQITGGSFYVGFDKVLHYFNSEAISAPFGLSDTPNGTTTFGYENFSLTDDTVQYVNAVYVVGTGISDWRPSAAAVAALRTAGTLRAMVVTNPEVVDATMLAAVGDAVLAQYNAIRKPSSLVTYQPGLRGGMNVQITHSGWGVAAVSYRIASIEAIPIDANRIRYQVFFGSNPISLGDLIRQTNMSVAEAYLAGAGAADSAVARVLDLSTGGGNLVPNSSFEEPSSWAVGAQWAIGVPAADAFHGKKEARLDSVGTPGLLGTPQITVDRTDDYWASAWIRCRAFTSGAPPRMVVEEYNAAGTFLAATVVATFPTVVGGWARISRQFSPVANIGVTVWQPTTAKAVIYFDNATVAATGSWSVDGVQLERADMVSAYAPAPYEIVDGSITTTEIADDAITSPKLTAGAVVAGKIAAGAVTADSLAAQSVTAAAIAAGTITADKLAALLILASQIKTSETGKRVEIDGDGIRLLDASSGLLVRIPTNTDPVYVSGQVEASSLVSVLTAELRGATTLTAGSVMTAQIGVTDPTSAPAVAASTPYLTLTTSPPSPGAGLCYDPAGDSGGATPTYWIGADPTIGNLLDLAYEYRASDGALLRTLRKTGTTTVVGATLGATTHVADTSDAWTGVVASQIATPVTMPRAGRVVSVSAYLAGYGGNASVKMAVWNSSGTLLRESAAFTVLSRSFSNGNDVRYAVALTSPLTVVSGQVLWIGFLHTSSGDGFFYSKDDGSGKTTKRGDGLDGSMTSIATNSASKPNVYIAYEYDADSSVEGAVAKIVGVARQGAYVWVLDAAGKLYRYAQSTLAYVDQFDLSAQISGTKANAGLFFDPTSGYLIITTATGVTASEQVKYVRVSTAGAFVSSQVTTGLVINGSTQVIRGGWPDGGTNYWTDLAGPIFGVTPYNVTSWAMVGLWDYGATGEINGGASQGGTGSGTGWSATAPTKIWLFTGWYWVSAAPANFWIGYTWHDSTGTVHETAISPRALVSMRRRQQLTITTPSIPSGGVEPADRVRVYMAQNASDPGGAGYSLQSTDAVTARTLQSFAAGAANPTVNNFPVGIPAEIKSVSAGWSLKGDGSAEFAAGASVGGIKLARYVALPTTIQVVNGATTTGDTGVVTSAEMTALPASGVVAVQVTVIVSTTVPVASTQVQAFDYDGDTTSTPVQAYGSPTAGYFASATGMVRTGGTNNRQMKYRCLENSTGTATYYVRVMGYWTTQ